MKLLVLVALTLVGFLQIRSSVAHVPDEAKISGKYVLESGDEDLLAGLGLGSDSNQKYTLEYGKVGDAWNVKQSANGKTIENNFKFGEEFDDNVVFVKKCRSTNTLVAPNIYEQVETKCTTGKQNKTRLEFDGNTLKITVTPEGQSSGKSMLLRKQ